MEFLKGILSEETYKKLSEELKDKTDVKLGNLASGEYIAKDKAERQITDLSAQLEVRSAQLEELGKKAKGNEEMTAEINKLKEENERQKQEYEKQISARERDYALDNLLRTAGARNLKAVKANLELDKIAFKDNKFEGIEDALAKLKESDAYLFDDGKPKGKAGLSPDNKPQDGDQFAELRKLR